MLINFRILDSCWRSSWSLLSNLPKIADEF